MSDYRTIVDGRGGPPAANLAGGVKIESISITVSTSEEKRPLIWLHLIPNALSLSRLAFAIVFPFASNDVRAVLILISALTDGVDGYIARRFRLTSWIGGLLDGACDKAFVWTVVLTFAFEDRFLWWELPVLLARDFAVLSLVGYAVVMRRWDGFRNMPSRFAGKATTVFMFLLLLYLAWRPGRDAVCQALLYAAMFCSAWAAVDYLTAFFRARQAERETGRRGAGWGA